MPNWKKVIVSGSNATLNSVNVTTNVVAQSFTGSLQGTSSWAVSALTASYADNFTVAGTLTAQTIVVQTITSSTDYVTGSTIFGSQLSNTHQFTGSVSITGSLTVNGVSNLTASNAVTASYALTASNVQGGTQYYVPLWDTNTSLASSYLNQSGSVLKTIYSGLDKGLTLDYNFNSFILGNAGTGNNTYLQVYDGGSVINIYSPNYTYFNGKVGIRIIPTNPGLAVSGSLEVTGPGTSKFMNSNVQIDGNLFMSGSNRLIYNDSTTNSMLFGFFDGGNIYGPYYQIFGNQYANTTQRGSAEFVYDNRNGGGSGFNIASFNGSTWTRKFRVDDNGAQVTGSLIVTNGITGSLYGTASWAENAVNALSAETASNIQGGATNYIPVFKTPTSLSSSVIYQSGSHIGINETNFTSGDPEALYVFQTHPTSFNVVTGKGNSNNYLQLNIQNTNTGTSASSDIVATADNGTETSNYIDMGINGSNFSGLIGDPNDAYLYSTGNHLHIGNITPGQPLQFFVGGDDTNLYRKLQLNDNNQHNMTGSFNVSGSVTAFSFTGSLYGTSSWAENAITASHAVNALSASYALNATNAISASYATSASHANNATSASYALNATNASTASYVLNAVSASFATTALTASYADNFTVAGTLTAQTIVVQTITSSTDYVTGSTIFGSLLSNTHQFTGSVSITGSLAVNNSNVILTNQTSSMTVLSSSYAISASYAVNADFLDGQDSSVFATTGSNIFIGNQTITGSLLVSGSTTQVGNNNLIGNTSLSGSLIISGALSAGTPTIQIFGDVNQTGYTRFLPVVTNINTSISASYIYVSGSTNDLYFSQNGSGYNNVTRLRWLEGNLYSGLLNGGLITSQSSTVYQVSSGSGVIVNLNASFNDNPYPTIKYLSWPNLSASIAPLSASYDQSFVAIDANAQIFAQGAPYSDGQFNTEIPIGVVLHQNHSTINGTQTFASLAYGWKQRSSDFIRAFGPLKLSGLDLYTSSSRGLTVGSGTAWSDGRNYTVDPNNPSYITDSGTTVSKIFRYRQSGSAAWVYDTNAGAGYTTIDPTQYSNNGVLTSVGAGNWSIQRVYWFPNSVTKAIYVYYGNAVYSTEADAIANLQFEPFVEAPNTAAQAVYLGAIVINGTGVFTNTNDYKLLPAGLFRSIGGTGGGGSSITQTLAGLSDVSISGHTNLQPLAYSTTAGKWINTSALSASIAGNAATATTASYAITASYALTATSASYALTASYVLNAVSSSYALNALSASYALTSTTASYATTASHALTASSADDFTVRGTLTAQTIVVQTITSSTDFVTGSTRFGSSLSNTHQFTGSVSITGSLAVSGNELRLDNGTTGVINLYSATPEIRFFSGDPTGYRLYRSGTNMILNSGGAIIQQIGGNNAYQIDATNGHLFRSAIAGGAILARLDTGGSLSIGKGGTAADASSILELSSTTKGFLPPRMTLAQRTAISSPAVGLIVYDTGSAATEGVWVYESTGWQQLLTNSGSQSILGSLTLTGTLTAQTIVAQTITSSTDFVTGSTRFGSLLSNTHQFTGSVSITGSLAASLTNINQNNVVGYDTTTGQLFYQSTSSLSVTSASYALNATSASYAATASTANSGFTIGTTQTYTNIVASTVVGSNNVFTHTTGSYTSAFYKYTVSNGANARSGEVIAVWNGSSAQYTDYSTLDIGSTSGVTPSVSVVGSDVLFNISTGTSGWRLKSTVTYL